MSGNNNLIRCECGKEFRGNFCPICGRRAVKVEQIQQPMPQQSVQRPAQQPNAQGYAQQTPQQTMPQQSVQRPAQQPTAQGYAQQTPQRPIPQQPVQRPVQQPNAQGYAQQTPQRQIPQQPVQRLVQQPNAQGYAQQTTQQTMPQQPVQRPAHQPNAQGYAQQTPQRPIPQQPVVQAYQYQGQQNAVAVNVNTSKKLDFMTVWNLIWDYRVSVCAPIAALIAFSLGYVFTGLTSIVFGICALPQVKAKFVGRKVLYYIIWAVCLSLVAISVGIESSQETEDYYDYTGYSDTYTYTNGGYVLGDTVDCGDWNIRVDSVEVNDLLDVMVTCAVTVENTSGYDKKFVSRELFVLDNNGVSDTAISMDDTNIVASGSVFTTKLLFCFSEYANKDVNNMTLNAGGNTIYLYS